MSPTVAFAFNCRALEKDPAPAADLTVECANCDPDNPRGVPREKCRCCKGTGRAPVAITVVMGEVHTSRLELLQGGKSRSRQSYDD
jgi:hypothetical protein